MENDYNMILESNYLNTNKSEDDEIILNYFNILKEYIFHTGENIIMNDFNQYLCTLQRGLSTLKHIFTILLLYTNNLELTVYHTKKAYLYYVEFVSQIGNESHSYLQLNSKDAALFILKKTIFEITQEQKESLTLNTEHKNKNKFIYLFCEIINNLFNSVLDNENMKGESKMSYIMYVITMLQKIVTKIVKIKEDLTKKIFICEIYLNFIKTSSISSIKDEGIFLNICNLLLKKLCLNPEKIQKNIKKNIETEDFDEKINSLTSVKFVNWVIS